MSDEYPDSWKPAAERAQEPRRIVFGSTGTGARFPLEVQPSSRYPSPWTGGREPTVIDGVVELSDEDN